MLEIQLANQKLIEARALLNDIIYREGYREGNVEQRLTLTEAVVSIEVAGQKIEQVVNEH